MSEHRCQTEIWNFENVIFCQQKIFRFDVAMGYPTVMQKILKIKKEDNYFWANITGWNQILGQWVTNLEKS